MSGCTRRLESERKMINSPGSGNQPLRILVADDEPMILRAVVRFLERRGHRVMTAGTAESALSLAKDETFDVVMADANMPGDGISILTTRSSDETFTGRLLLMTGALLGDYADRLNKKVLFLKKPFAFDQVIEMVEGRAGP